MPRPLTDFNPKWTGLLRPKSGEGFEFDCPKCNARGVGHRLCVYFSNPLDGQPPAPWQIPMWTREGATFENLTVEPSIQYPCFHGWIEDGIVIDISESPLAFEFPGKGIVALSPRQVSRMVLGTPSANPPDGGSQPKEGNS